MNQEKDDARTVVLVIEGTYPWYRGGVSEWVYRYLLAFPDYGFRIVQIATDEWNTADLSTALYPVPPQVERFERTLPPVLPDAEWAQGFADWVAPQQAHLMALCRGADWVHVANTGFAGWLGKTLAEKTGLPLMLTEHALYWKEVDLGTVALECGYKIPDDEKIKEEVSRSFQTIAREVYAAATHTISVSQCNMPFQKQFGAASPIYISNGVDADWIVADKAQARDRLTIGWIGRCAAIKDPLRFFDLIDAFREIQQSEDGMMTTFKMVTCDAGEHDLEKEVRNRANDYPELTMIWNAATIDHIDDMDAVCITSVNESQPLVLFEALARQVLPVGWTVGDATDHYGILVPQDTSAMALARTILQSRQDEKQWDRLLKPRHEMVCRSHTWDAVFKTYRALFNGG